MEPPAPASTAGRPQASFRAERADLYARPPDRAVNGAATEPGSTLTCAPQGACAVRCAASASRAAAASSPGATRMLTLARATGTSVFEAAATDGASMPITAMAGPAQSRAVDRKSVV